MTSSHTGAGASSDPAKLQLTFWIAIAGIGAVLVVFGLAVLAFHDAKNPGQLIPAVVGSVTGAIGTLAGLVAGHTAGAAGKAEAEQPANSNQEAATAGRTLAQAVLNDAPSPPMAQEGDIEPFGGDATRSTDIARQHAALAKRLFPDLVKD
jgi:hypothetical protein